MKHLLALLSAVCCAACDSGRSSRSEDASSDALHDIGADGRGRIDAVADGAPEADTAAADAAVDLGQISSEWIQLKFLTELNLGLVDPVFDFHRLGGDAAFEVHADGSVFAKGYPDECLGMRPYMEWRLPAAELEVVSTLVRSTRIEQAEDRHVCLGCTGCGREALTMVFDDRHLELRALPAFNPREGCGEHYELVDPFAPEVQSLTDTLRDVLRHATRLGEGRASPPRVRLGVFPTNAWPDGEPVPDTLEWPLGEAVPLSGILALAERRTYGTSVLEAEVAHEAWAFCTENSDAWHSRYACGPSLFLKVTDAGQEYLIGCAPALPLELE